MHQKPCQAARLQKGKSVLSILWGLCAHRDDSLPEAMATPWRVAYRCTQDLVGGKGRGTEVTEKWELNLI